MRPPGDGALGNCGGEGRVRPVHDVHGVVRDLGLAALVADAAVNPHAVEARVVDRVELVDGGRGRARS